MRFIPRFCIPSTSIESVCPSTKTAIITYGHGIGKRVNVCTDRECPVHHPQRTHTPDPEWEARQNAAQQEREERDKQRARRQKRFAALIARIPSSLNDEQTRFMLGALVLGDLDRSCEAMAMRHVEDEDTNECAEDVCARILANLDTTSCPASSRSWHLEVIPNCHALNRATSLKRQSGYFPPPGSPRRRQPKRRENSSEESSEESGEDHREEGCEEGQITRYGGWQPPAPASLPKTLKRYTSTKGWIANDEVYVQADRS